MDWLKVLSGGQLGEDHKSARPRVFRAHGCVRSPAVVDLREGLQDVVGEGRGGGVYDGGRDRVGIVAEISGGREGMENFVDNSVKVMGCLACCFIHRFQHIFHGFAGLPRDSVRHRHGREERPGEGWGLGGCKVFVGEESARF